MPMRMPTRLLIGVPRILINQMKTSFSLLLAMANVGERWSYQEILHNTF